MRRRVRRGRGGRIRELAMRPDVWGEEDLLDHLNAVVRRGGRVLVVLDGVVHSWDLVDDWRERRGQLGEES